ncbi:sulfonate ABC transporter periplasmic sulfonate-binding protein SsuA [Actinorhabdospora filicis]|uniref:Sulfonate ABC transporter periplasmic sulfonate-binding protein SsuA n=1 Tax=Actinorhabdospora filicis TaxID=1785913 RepID=A0A9W6WBI6_9ACTN|nr:ABC transporter substrate-binding protein [Actinorhabdospora filicis]GLZ80659.1 sulfonate ABC transporter periplasmic sulfonate-binding protein SsuA [Actinorhabdospora filicis]
MSRFRRLLGLALAVTALAGCAAQKNEGPTLALDAPLPASVTEGTKLVIGDPATKIALQLSGELDKFSFPIEWANISGGPQTLEAFRADALDIGAVAEIPAIHATWTNLPVKIVASKFRQDPLAHPVYRLGVAPGVTVSTLADLRGKKIAFSPGQAQGALILRVLKKAGLTKDDVQLIELPSTGDVYPNALAAKQVDVAPIGGVAVPRYLAKYGKDGATAIDHGLRDDPSHLYVRTETLEDPGKAAAIAEYVKAWGRATKWVYEHPQEWIQGYYVADQHISKEDGEYLVQNAGQPDVPADWSDVIARHQETIDLLAAHTGNPVFKSENLFDRRFEKIGAEGYAGSTA